MKIKYSFKRRMRVIAMLVLGWYVVTSGDTVKAKPSLDFKNPQAGKTYEGLIRGEINVKNIPNGQYKVRLDCFEVTHHIALKPHPNAKPGQLVTMNIKDNHLPCRSGTHTMEITITPRETPHSPILKDRITFHITQPKGPNQYKLNSAFENESGRLLGFENRYRGLQSFPKSDGPTKRILAHQADQLHEQRIRVAFSTLWGFVSLANTYHEALDRNRALGALQTATTFYEQDLPRLTIHPTQGNIPYHDTYYTPYFMRQMADLYATYAHLDQALEWSQKYIKFFDQKRKLASQAKQRQSATFELSYIQQRIGMYYLLLTDDMQAWEQHQAQAENLRKQAMAIVVPEN